LAKIVLKLGHGPIGLLQHVRSIEPPVEQALAGVGRADVAFVPELRLALGKDGNMRGASRCSLGLKTRFWEN